MNYATVFAAIAIIAILCIAFVIYRRLKTWRAENQRKAKSEQFIKDSYLRLERVDDPRKRQRIQRKMR